jgi:peptide deformylase
MRDMKMIDIDKCQITHYPAGVLGKRAESVEEINDNILRLVEKMFDIMLENKGIGLAAPQAGVSLRLFIISLDGSRENVKAYVNPTVTPIGELEGIEEGCLSVSIRRFGDTKNVK